MVYYELEVSSTSCLGLIESFSPLALTLEGQICKALFASLDEALLVKSAIRNLAKINIIPDKNWILETQSTAKIVSEKLLICASDAKVIKLKPSIAFGSGTHPTTILCLRWLESNNVTDLSCLDFGCGSGVLAIAAASYGAKEVYALDIDPQAEKIAFENSNINGLNNIFVKKPAKNSQDIIFANILLRPLLELKEEFISLLKPNGKLIISGILDDEEAQACELQAAYSQNFKLVTQQSLDAWRMLELQHR